jgi:UDP-N-acetyl-D-glucosamine dehydrogenase
MSANSPDVADQALKDALAAIEQRRHVIGIIGLGYVGIPLMLAAVRAGFLVKGFDINPKRVDDLNAGRCGFTHIDDREIAHAIADRRFSATTDFTTLEACDSILITVPTPLTKNREPDLSFVVRTAEVIAQNLRRNQLVVLESTTWPGTTLEVVKPILETTGLASGRDFFLAFSPEREDPGNPKYGTASIPKVVGGDGPHALELATKLYGSFVVSTVAVSSPSTAEAVKLTENIFRAVNISLVNELKMVYSRMGIDIWEVIEVAKTKPFGFMPFYPGPGLGGHCIPIDPFYLTWKAREFDITPRFIELAGQINAAMPHYVVGQLAEALDRTAGRGLRDARVLIIGVAYKKNVEDMRESPSLRLIEMIEQRGAKVDYHDPFVPVIPMTREHAALAGRTSKSLDAGMIAGYDAVLIATDHDVIDWRLLAEHARLIVDTRNACGRAGIVSDRIVKA